MKNFKKVVSIVLILSVFVFIPMASFASHPGHNACNPCAKNACNPCAKNACNPCGKNACNPCNPCNPCGGDKINFFRDKKFSSLKEVIAYGEKLANDPSLGKSGKSCNKCHEGGRALKKSVLLPYPHYVKMPKDVVTLDQMINFCMINPMMTDPLSYGSREMTAIAAYVISSYPKAYSVKRASNPCAGKNPCGAAAANPCGGNPCGK